MPPVWRQVLHNLGDRVNEDLLPAIYDAVALPTSEIRQQLRAEGLAYHDPQTGREPGLESLDASAELVIRRARRVAAASGAVAGFAGAAAVPPEVIGSIVGTLRLAQRLAVIYGHEPETDRGRLLLWRGLAAAYEIEPPTQGSFDVHLRDLPRLILRQQAEVERSLASFARTLVARATVSVGRRTIRMLPGAGAGLAALAGRRRVQSQGGRMLPVFRRAFPGTLLITGPIEEAVEVRR